jgi:hypothetical protein
MRDGHRLDGKSGLNYEDEGLEKWLRIEDG